MEIRSMTPADVKEIAELDKICFSIPWSWQAFADEMENPIAVYFVAAENEKLVGYGGFWQAADEGDITNIAVLPEYRRCGVGSEILKKLVNRAVSMGLVQLNLEVRKGNKPARGLYSKFGFEPIGERKRYYSDNNEDAVIMAKRLNTDE